jgi:hypothetical protein
MSIALCSAIVWKFWSLAGALAVVAFLDSVIGVDPPIIPADLHPSMVIDAEKRLAATLPFPLALVHGLHKKYKKDV